MSDATDRTQRLVYLVLQAAVRLGIDTTHRTGPNARETGGQFERWELRNRVDSDSRGLRIKFNGETKIVDMPTAALWLLLLGLPEVAVTCPDCQARSATGGKLARWEWKRALSTLDYHDGWEQTAVSVYGDGNISPNLYNLVLSRPCPTCTVDGQPLGQVQREPARLLLDAMPRSRSVCCDGTIVDSTCTNRVDEPGDPTARDVLTVFADQLQASGDPRGTWIALWLRGPDVFATALGEIKDALCVVDCPRVESATTREVADHQRAGVL